MGIDSIFIHGFGMLWMVCFIVPVVEQVCKSPDVQELHTLQK
jgi:hypothetical protein